MGPYEDWETIYIPPYNECVDGGTSVTYDPIDIFGGWPGDFGSINAYWNNFSFPFVDEFNDGTPFRDILMLSTNLSGGEHVITYISNAPVAYAIYSGGTSWTDIIPGIDSVTKGMTVWIANPGGDITLTWNNGG